MKKNQVNYSVGNFVVTLHGTKADIHLKKLPLNDNDNDL